MDKLGNDVFVQKIGTLIEDAINTVFKCRGDGNWCYLCGAIEAKIVEQIEELPEMAASLRRHIELHKI